MKLKIFVALLLVAGAWLAGRQYVGARAGGAGRAAESRADAGGGVAAPSGAVSEEGGEAVQRIDKSYRLAPGANVEVRGIDGAVEIATAEGDTAEVHVEARAGDARSLERGLITVEHTGDRLVVRGPSNGGGGGGGFLSWITGRGGRRTRHSVRLLLPRRVTLDANGINGDLRVGHLEGGLEVSGVNGDVEAGSAAGGSEVSGVNGSVLLSLASVGPEGVRVSGVNGPVDLRLAPTINADIDAVGIDGDVENTLTNATVLGPRQGPFKARLGAGGPHINVSGIHGPVTLAGR